MVFEPESSLWEDEAIQGVRRALEQATFDEIRGVVIIGDISGDRRLNEDCKTAEELRVKLEEIYDSMWYGHVPIEGGEALFLPDSVDFVSELMEVEDLQLFFENHQDEEGEKILDAGDLLDAEGARFLRFDLVSIDEDLVKFLARHPQYMKELNPRKFEELIAEMFANMGYEVELTPQSRDGGVDIYAIKKDGIGGGLVLIECKRYTPPKKVGVGIVRGLYGVVEAKKATRGLIATTSFFTRDAQAEQQKLKYRLALADYNDLVDHLRTWSQLLKS